MDAGGENSKVGAYRGRETLDSTDGEGDSKSDQTCKGETLCGQSCGFA